MRRANFWERVALVCLILTICIATGNKLRAQARLADHKDSALKIFSRLLSFNDSSVPDFSKSRFTDSLSRQLSEIPKRKLKKIASHYAGMAKLTPDSLSRLLQSRFSLPVLQKRKFITAQGGYVNYNYSYRSNIDTPFLEKDLSQHFLNAGIDFNIMEQVPVRVMYFERKSNSRYFSDFRDVRIEFNAPQFRQVKQEQLRKQFYKTLDKVKDPDLSALIDGEVNKSTDLSRWLKKFSVLNDYSRSAQIYYNKHHALDTIGNKDSAIAEAGKFIEFYKSREAELKALQSNIDSLRKLYVTTSKRVQKLLKLFNKNGYTQQGLKLIKNELREAGIRDKRFEKLANTLYAIRSFAVGRTLPSMSNLTVSNINVNGINFEYNANNLYAAFTAGAIDFRLRDYSRPDQKKAPQHVAAASLGYGLKEGNHIIVTGFDGRRQLYYGLRDVPASRVYGMSVESQMVITDYVRLTAEAAQSSTPLYINTSGTASKSGFSFRDKTNKAYSLQLYSYIPQTLTRLEAFYQYMGINFYNFTSFRTNASTTSWNVKMEQYVWNQQLKITGAVRKNDFSNPFVIQRYSSNTIFKTISATFRKRNWPSLSVGYIPSSQYTAVDNQVYENRYHSLNVYLGHYYKIGTATATGALTYNKFYNKGSDTGFIYYNADNYYAWHQVNFTHFTASSGFSRTANSQYVLNVLEAGVQSNFLKPGNIGFGFKINHFNRSETKVGLYGSGRWRFGKMGEINFWYERGFVPGYRNQLIKNEWLNLGFTRYFKS
jgi:hypothetical protein